MNYLEIIGEKIADIKETSVFLEGNAVQLAVEGEIARRKKIYKLKKCSGKGLPIGEIGSHVTIFKTTSDNTYHTLYHAKKEALYPSGTVKSFGYEFMYRPTGIQKIEINVMEDSILNDFLNFLNNVAINLDEIKEGNNNDQ